MNLTEIGRKGQIYFFAEQSKELSLLPFADGGGKESGSIERFNYVTTRRYPHPPPSIAGGPPSPQGGRHAGHGDGSQCQYVM